VLLGRPSAAVFLLIFFCSPAWAGICRVTTAGSPLNDGSSWAAPVPLQPALATPGTCTEIWVAKGLYKPTATTDTSISFSVANGVAVYGGFAGNETVREQSDPSANLTVLSGDIDNNDTTDANGVDVDSTHIVGSNSKTVVVLHNVGSGTVLDGFTITGGDNRPASSGGGLICDGSASQDGPSLSRLVFIGNAASNGGAINIKCTSGNCSSPSFSSVTFIGNRATQFGGAIYNLCLGVCSPTLSGATFNANSAGDSGGAIYISESRASFSNVTFVGNHASKGGAIFKDAPPLTGYATPQLNFVTFSDNQADTRGGAIASTGSGHLVLHNTILWGDHAPLGFGAEIDNTFGAITTTDHSIVKGSGGSAAWNPAFGTDGGGNLDVDPRLGPLLASNFSGMQTLLPGTGSPAIDAGIDAGCPAEDQRGIARPQGAHCDIGAVETFSIDLIGHKGFEACWSQALTKPAFLELVHTTVDNSTLCVAPFSTISGSACITPACPGAVVGCPVTIHSGPFADGGSFIAGRFSASGSADDVSVPAFVAPSSSCTYTASNITIGYAPDYAFTDDGNRGAYAALVNRFAATVTNSSFVTGSGIPDCQIAAASLGQVFAAYVQATLFVDLRQKLQTATASQSVCPLSP
jgi:predicted outer membrane repeat protein